MLLLDTLSTTTVLRLTSFCIARVSMAYLYYFMLRYSLCNIGPCSIQKNSHFLNGLCYMMLTIEKLILWIFH